MFHKPNEFNRNAKLDKTDTVCQELCLCERGEERASTQTDEHDVMSAKYQTEKDGKDLCEDNDPLSPSENSSSA